MIIGISISDFVADISVIRISVYLIIGPPLITIAVTNYCN